MRCCEHIFFGGLKIDPAKAAACVASVAVEGEKRDAAQWLGVDSQLVRSDFQHQLDPEQIVFWHCASHWAMTPWNDDIAGCILAHAQRQMPWRSFCFLFLNDPITQWMREHTEAQIKNI